MKTFVYNLIISSFFLSCRANEQKNESDLSAPSMNVAVKQDTTIKYDIEGISSEGSEAQVEYSNGLIKRSTINVYGETGQARIVYTFLPTQINVDEKEFRYKTSLENVDSGKDMVLKREIQYLMDFNGNPSDMMDKERLDIFQEFKRTVPFELK